MNSHNGLCFVPFLWVEIALVWTFSGGFFFSFVLFLGWFFCSFFFFLKSVVLSLLLSHLRNENPFHDYCHPDYLPLPVLNQFFSISLDEICNQCSWLFIKPGVFNACCDCCRQEVMSQQLSTHVCSAAWKSAVKVKLRPPFQIQNTA